MNPEEPLVVLTIRISKSDADYLDQALPEGSKSAYFRSLIHEHIKKMQRQDRSRNHEES